MDSNISNEGQQGIPNFAVETDLASDLLLSVSIFGEVNKAQISNLAFGASEELKQMAQEEKHLWVFDEIKNSYVLNEVEYKCRFASLDATLEEVIRVITAAEDSNLIMDLKVEEQNQNGEKKLPSKFETEASRATAVVYADAITLVHMLINVVNSFSPGQNCLNTIEYSDSRLYNAWTLCSLESSYSKIV